MVLQAIRRPADQDEQDSDHSHQREEFPQCRHVACPIGGARVENLIEGRGNQIGHQDKHDEDPDGHLDSTIHHGICHCAIGSREFRYLRVLTVADSPDFCYRYTIHRIVVGNWRIVGKWVAV